MADAPPSLPPINVLPKYIYPSELLCRFLATFPTLIQQKIKYVFDNVEDDFGGLVQFWSPVKIDGRWLLTTSDQPYFQDEHDEAFEKYRLCSVKYKYNIDVNYKVQVEDDPMIINGAPAAAFINKLPELFPDLTFHQMSPLESTAFECGLIRSIVLPVFYGSQSCCVGVIECCSSFFRSLEHMFDELRPALEEVGLQLFQGVERLPYTTICSLKNAKKEIDEALKIIWQTHRLDFAQVWIAYKDSDRVAFSSSLEDTQTKRILGFKLTDFYDNSSDDYVSDRLDGYSKICYMFSLKMGEGLIGKTLQTYEPPFIKKVSDLRDNEPQMLLSCTDCEGIPFECSCFVICLRSNETGDLEYVFEFIWREGPNYVKLLESLLFSLKRCLPNFKYSVGGEIGDELRIIDVENSAKSKIKSFKIFQGNKSSSASEALEKSRLLVKECLTPLEAKCKTNPISLSQEDMIEAAKSLNVCLSTLKRKCNDLEIEWHKKDYVKRNVNNESDKNEGAFQDPLADNKEMYLDENTVTIKVEYADDMIKFHLPISSATFADIVKEIGDGLKLNPANYKLQYLDQDGDWILMNSDKDVRVCIKDLRNSTSIIRMRLLPAQNI